MTPRATDSARERDASRVYRALGVSVALHVLGAVALWRGVSEPEPPRPGGPLQVELVWRDASRQGGPMGVGPSSGVAPPPVRASGSAARPAPARRSPEKPEAPRSKPETVTPVAAPPLAGARVEVPASAPVEAPSAPVPGSPLEGPASPGGTGEGRTESEAGGEGAPGGAGAGVGTSASGSPGGSGAGAGAESELRVYREQLSQRVLRQRRYPSHAVRLGMEGTALVRVRIHRDGSLAAPPRLEGSSRFRVLDVEALRMVEAAAPFAPLPSELSREPAEFVIPVSFALRAAG